MTLGSGLGFGLVVDGRLQEPTSINHLAGHIPIRPTAQHCYCGFNGCLEVLVNTAAISDCLTDPDKFANIPELMVSGGAQYGMQTFDQAIMRLYKQGLINYEEAMSNATNPDDFNMRVKGVVGASDRWGTEDASKSTAGEFFK